MGAREVLVESVGVGQRPGIVDHDGVQPRGLIVGVQPCEVHLYDLTAGNLSGTDRSLRLGYGGVDDLKAWLVGGMRRRSTERQCCEGKKASDQTAREVIHLCQTSVE